MKNKIRENEVNRNERCNNDNNNDIKIIIPMIIIINQNT